MINGLAGFVIWTEEGPETISFAVEHDQIVGVNAVRNPDQLRHLS